MSDYPVMFTVRDAISGNGFLAGVTMSGRVVMREEDGKWWVHGVRPGGITASGGTPMEAFTHFRQSYKNVLFDLSDGSNSYEEFNREVEALYFQTNEVEDECWEAAFKKMRSGGTPTEGFFSNLPKEAPETRPTVYTVVRLDQHAHYQASDNIPDYCSLPIAA